MSNGSSDFLSQLENVFSNGLGEYIQGRINQQFSGPVSTAPLDQSYSPGAAALTSFQTVPSWVWIAGAVLLLGIGLVLVMR